MGLTRRDYARHRGVSETALRKAIWTPDWGLSAAINGDESDFALMTTF